MSKDSLIEGFYFQAHPGGELQLVKESLQSAGKVRLLHLQGLRALALIAVFSITSSLARAMVSLVWMCFSSFPASFFAFDKMTNRGFPE